MKKFVTDVLQTAKMLWVNWWSVTTERRPHTNEFKRVLDSPQNVNGPMKTLVISNWDYLSKEKIFSKYKKNICPEKQLKISWSIITM